MINCIRAELNDYEANKDAVIWHETAALQAIKSCLDAAPLECCGLLLGYMDNDLPVVQQIRLMRNISAEPATSFLFDPEQWINALYNSDSASLDNQLLGIFHSHPDTAAIPSKTDQSVQWLFPIYAIISLAEKKMPHLCCYRMSSVDPWKKLSVMFRSD